MTFKQALNIAASCMHEYAEFWINEIPNAEPSEAENIEAMVEEWKEAYLILQERIKE